MLYLLSDETDEFLQCIFDDQLIVNVTLLEAGFQIEHWISAHRLCAARAILLHICVLDFDPIAPLFYQIPMKSTKHLKIIH